MVKKIEDVRGLIWSLRDVTADDLARTASTIAAARDAAAVVTCTRAELYATDETALPHDLPPPRVLAGRDALRHLAAVAAGADSLVIGETDVLAQVRAAFASAGGVLRAFADIAVAAGREARDQTPLEARDAGRQLDLALLHLGATLPGRVCIAGAGAMAGHLARRSLVLGVDEVFISGRHRARVAACAAAANARTAEVADLPELTEGACLVLAFKGAPAEPMARAIEAAAARSEFTVDLTMPRFRWPATMAARTVDLEQLARSRTVAAVDAALRERLRDAASCSVQRRWDHIHAEGAEMAARLYRHVEGVRAAEVARAARSTADAAMLDVVTKAVVKRLFHAYGKALRAGEDPALAPVTQRLFLEARE